LRDAQLLKAWKTLLKVLNKKRQALAEWKPSDNGQTASHLSSHKLQKVWTVLDFVIYFHLAP
jgi:hypothetical protein